MIVLTILLVALLPAPRAQARQSDSAPAQSSTTTQAIAQLMPAPGKPADVLQLASTMNGVDIPSTQPWHVKLTYDQFDEDGDNVHSGTFEEVYAGPRKYKEIYTSDTLNQTNIAAESGLYRSGDQRWPGSTELQIRNGALLPLFRAHTDEPHTKLNKSTERIGGVKLSCITLHHIEPHSLELNLGAPRFCFDPSTVMLRYVWDGIAEYTYNNFVQFQNHYVARDIAVTHDGKPFLKIHIEELEPLPRIDESLFTPPPGSSGPIGGRIALAPGVLMDEYLVSRGRLVHPRTANGKVNIRFVVGKDGSVIQADVVDGPVPLHDAALAAIRGYKFRPFLVSGQPVEVESSYSFEFH